MPVAGDALGCVNTSAWPRKMPQQSGCSAPHGGSSPPRPGSGSAPKPHRPPRPRRPNRAPAAHRRPAPVGQGMPVFDDIMNEALKARGIPGGALAIAKDGKLLVARGYGLANVQTREPVTLDTLFSTASVTKTITAAAVLHLVDQGSFRWTIRSIRCWASRGRWAGRRSIPRSRRSPCGNCCCMRAAGIRSTTATCSARRRRSPVPPRRSCLSRPIPCCVMV